VAESEIDPISDWQGFYDELHEETPRGAVILGAAFLDAQLRELLADFMIDESKIVDSLVGSEKELEKPLSNFGARIKASYCLGLISKKMYDDLRTINKLRNKFAHRLHDFTFEDEEVVSWCKSLSLAKMITDKLPHFPDDHGSMFLLGITQLSVWVALKRLEAKRQKREPPEDPKMRQVVHAG